MRPLPSSANYTLALLTLIYTSAWIDRGVIIVLSQPIKADLGIADWQIGLLTGFAFSVLYSVLGIPLARLAEWRSRIVILSVCLVIWSAATALSALATSFVTLLALRCCVGIGEAGSGPSSHSLLSDCFPAERRTMALSVYGLGVPLGMMIGSIAGGWTAQHYGWRTALLVVGIPGLLLATITYLTLREPERGANDDRSRSVIATDRPSLRDVLRLLMGKSTFRHMAVGLTLFCIGMSGFNAFLAPYYARKFALDFTTVGILIGFVGSSAGMIGTLAGGHLAQRLGQRTPRWFLLIPAIGIAGAALFIIVALRQTSWQATAAILLIPQILSACYLAPVFAVAHNMVESRMRATAAAILFFVMNMIGMSLGPLLVGLASDLFTAHFLGASPSDACSAGATLMTGAPALAKACQAAIADGTNAALLSCTPLLLWGAVHYYIASRTVADDIT